MRSHPDPLHVRLEELGDLLREVCKDLEAGITPRLRGDLGRWWNHRKKSDEFLVAQRRREIEERREWLQSQIVRLDEERRELESGSPGGRLPVEGSAS